MMQEQTETKPRVVGRPQEKSPPKTLTLQQKFVKLREAIPGITQAQYSEGVQYKFAKIFDVYRLLTPAMNEWCVNFDIVAENATRHTADGDPAFYYCYQASTKNGKRTVWVYEADLTIRWTDADNPADVLEVTLHAIGTNDGGPDKAKGSAWTYCLKYYFFEKFGIDQGDEDPDINDLYGTAAGQPPSAQSKPAAAPNMQSERNIQPQAQTGQNGRAGARRPLSDAQLSRMYRKGEDAMFTREQINTRIVECYAQQDPHYLTRAQYDEICNALDKARKQGGNANA